MGSTFPPPASRSTDPPSSGEAAREVEPGNSVLTETIRMFVNVKGAGSAWQIADLIEYVYPGRWQESTIRTAVSRTLTKTGEYGIRKGRKVALYDLSQTTGGTNAGNPSGRSRTP